MTIGDAWGFSSIASIALSGDLSDRTLTDSAIEDWVRIRVRTLLWKTKSNKSIPVMEDGISRLLYHHHDYCITTMRACCKKGDYHGRQACRLDVEKAVLPERIYFLVGWTQHIIWWQ